MKRPAIGLCMPAGIPGCSTHRLRIRQFFWRNSFRQWGSRTEHFIRHTIIGGGCLGLGASRLIHDS